VTYRRLYEKAAFMGYMAGWATGGYASFQPAYDTFRHNFIALYCYRRGFSIGKKERRRKIRSGEWVWVNGTYAPPPKCDTAMLEIIRKYQVEQRQLREAA
jgi:hypothetical protein